MYCSTVPAPHVMGHVLQHRPRDGGPVQGSGAPAQLIEGDDGPNRGGVCSGQIEQRTC